MHVEPILGDVDADEHELSRRGCVHRPRLWIRARHAAPATVRAFGHGGERGATLRHGLIRPSRPRAPVRRQPRPAGRGWQLRDTSRYEYGVGKLEQFVWLIVGLSLVIGALWVASRVVTTVLSSAPPASPLALTLSALVNAINLAVSFLGWYAMRVAARDEPFGVIGAQLRAKLTMLLSSLYLQVTLTVAALAKDDAIALTLDAFGATFVVALMLYKRLADDRAGTTGSARRARD